MKPLRVSQDMLDFGYTDLCVIVSATMRSSWKYYCKLQKEVPEVLLGYNIRLATPDTVKHLRGMIITKYYVDGYTWQVHMSHKVERAINELSMCTMGSAIIT